jgi:hypothetical protein
MNQGLKLMSDYGADFLNDASRVSFFASPSDQAYADLLIEENLL